MLPPELHKEACKLFVTWLHRLEERDRRNAETKQQNSHKEIYPTSTATDTDVADRTSPRPSLPDLPTSEHTGAEEKRLG